jgi:hypothetical protein
MKIEFLSTSFKNFLTFGNVTQHFELKPGMNLITGLDQGTGRSNGSGKCVEGSTKIDITVTDEAKDKFMSFLRR